MTEYFQEPPVRLWGEELDLQSMTSEELLHYGKLFKLPFLIIRAEERQVVEGAEDFLREVNDKPNEGEQ